MSRLGSILLFGALATGCLEWQQQLDGCRDSEGKWTCASAQGDGGALADAGDAAAPSDGGPGGCPGFEADGWCWENPLPHGIGLRAVWGSARDDVWAAGDNGLLMHFDGSQWTSSLVGSATADRPEFRTITGRSAGEVYVAGRPGEIFGRDGGTWQRLRHVNSAIHQLALSPDGGLWMATDDWVGTSQTARALNAGSSDYFSGLTFTPSGECFAASTYFNNYVLPFDLTVRRCDGGEAFSWNGLGEGWAFHSGQMWTDALGAPWVAKSGDLSGGFATFRGGNWLKIEGLGEVTDVFAGSGLSAGGSVGVGQAGTVALAGTASSASLLRFPFREDMNGSDLQGVWTSPTDEAFVVGEGGLRGWGPIDSPAGWQVQPEGSTLGFHALAAAGDTMIAAGENQSLYQRTDGGWAQKNLDSFQRRYLGLYLSETGDFVAAGTSVLTYGNIVEAPTTIATQLDIEDLWGRAPDDVVLVSSQQLFAFDPQASEKTRPIQAVSGDTLVRVTGDATGRMWAVGAKGLVLHRPGPDAGWLSEKIEVGSAALRAIAAGPNGTAWAAGESDLTFQRNLDGGWVSRPAGLGMHFTDLAIAADGGVFGVGSDGEVAHFGAQGWKRLPPFSGNFLRRALIKDGWLWVCGDNGTIARRKLP